MINSKCFNKKCNFVGYHEVIDFHENDNINNLPHAHLKCVKCGGHHNRWIVDDDILKNIFQSEYNNYKNIR